jgi:hypothetical protein
MPDLGKMKNIGDRHILRLHSLVFLRVIIILLAFKRATVKNSKQVIFYTGTSPQLGRLFFCA